jgi:hypothetical protein
MGKEVNGKMSEAKDEAPGRHQKFKMRGKVR